MSTDKAQRWQAFKPEASNGWWTVARHDGSGACWEPAMTFHGSDAREQAQNHARLFNLADGMEERMKRLEAARAFVAASALHAHGDQRITAVCQQLLNALSEEAIQ
jgi:hypothetical protein